jgi:peptidoglycan hydrolase CwlO-like protein
MALIRLVVTLGFLGAAQAVTPMEKVLTLIGDLKKDLEAEGKKEAASYEKFSCFCKDATKKKSKSITDGQDEIDTTTADIGSKTATRKEKITKKGEEQQKLEDTEKKLQETTEQYLKDKSAYENTNADLTKAVNSAKRAHKALSDSGKAAAFIDLGTKSDVRNCLDIAMAMGMVQDKANEAATSFLQVDPNDPEYKFHSDKILKIIKDLQDDFQTEKDKVNKEWTKTENAYKSEKKDLEGKIDTAEKNIKKLTGEIDKLKSQIAKLKSDLESAEDNLKDDSAYLKDLTVRCEFNANAWDQRSKTRDGEVKALAKALDILNKGAKDKVGKRALLITPVKKSASPAATAPVKAAAAKSAKPAADVKASAKKAISFLQTASASRQERAVAVLRGEGARLGSTTLSSLASQIEGNPFVKISKLIQNLIERLLEESKAEATKKGFCDTELGKSYKTRDNRFADVNRLDVETEELETHKKKLELEISDLTDEVKDLKDDLKKATDQRKDDKEDNEKAIKTAKEGAVAVGEALVVLQDFYKSAAKGKVLLQASPVDEDTSFEDFSANKGSQSASKGILGLLEVIKTDFERTARKTEDEEAKAHAEFTLFDRSSKSDIASKTMKKELDEQDLDSTKSAIDDNMKDLATAQKLLDSALKNVEDLKPTCIDTGMSYSERVKKREEEMKALGKALCILDEDGVEPECRKR